MLRHIFPSFGGLVRRIEISRLFHQAHAIFFLLMLCQDISLQVHIF
jgi:hypothetical protein